MAFACEAIDAPENAEAKRTERAPDQAKAVFDASAEETDVGGLVNEIGLTATSWE